MRFSLGVLVGTIALALPATALAKPPTPTTQAADGITSTSAVLHGKLTSLNSGNTYNFAFGQTTAYGSATAMVTHGGLLGALLPSTVYTSATITGLKPGTTYHFRLVGRDGNNASYGADVTFTTLSASSPLSPAPTTTLPEPDPGTDPGSTDPGADPGADAEPSSETTTTAPDHGPAPEPELGKSVVAGVDQGTVKVRVPGASGFTTLTGADAIPTGALLDTRAGTVVLETATSTGPQSVSLRGALFQVRQPAGGRGMTEFVLRGGDFSACNAPTGNARAAAKRVAKPKRTLWAQDDNGKFRTRGRNSVATVRGTSWVTTETCEGTRTRVTEGAVAVRDLARNKTVIVRAGHSYLARGAAR